MYVLCTRTHVWYTLLYVSLALVYVRVQPVVLCVGCMSVVCLICILFYIGLFHSHVREMEEEMVCVCVCVDV